MLRVSSCRITSCLRHCMRSWGQWEDRRPGEPEDSAIDNDHTPPAAPPAPPKAQGPSIAACNSSPPSGRALQTIKVATTCPPRRSRSPAPTTTKPEQPSTSESRTVGRSSRSAPPTTTEPGAWAVTYWAERSNSQRHANPSYWMGSQVRRARQRDEETVHHGPSRREQSFLGPNPGISPR